MCIYIGLYSSTNQGALSLVETHPAFAEWLEQRQPSGQPSLLSGCSNATTAAPHRPNQGAPWCSLLVS